jgi:hypothetical protein
MFLVLTSVDPMVNPLISTGRLILPVDNISFTVQHICSTYNVLSGNIVDFDEEENQTRILRPCRRKA